MAPVVASQSLAAAHDNCLAATPMPTTLSASSPAPFARSPEYI
jgi:hypothetical protein